LITNSPLILAAFGTLIGADLRNEACANQRYIHCRKASRSQNELAPRGSTSVSLSSEIELKGDDKAKFVGRSQNY
jgi:hypothetical protein